MTIYESATTDKPAIDYFCYDTWSVSTIFRQTAAPTTTGKSHRVSLSPTSISQLTVNPTDTTSITAAPGSSTTTALAASATSTGTSSSSPSKDDSGGGASKAWIAGAVIGPVAGAVLVFGLGYWFARRRLRERHVPQPPSSSGNQDLYSPLPPSPAQNVHIAPLHEKDGNARPLQPSELPS